MQDTLLEAWRNPPEYWQDAYAYAIRKVGENLAFFLDGYPAPASVDEVYPKIANVEWTSGFYNGMLWLAYLRTKDTDFKEAAEATLADYQRRLDERIETGTHDLGFLYILSAKAHYLITGEEKAREVALQAADILMERYHPKAGIIQAWGDLTDPAQRGRIIIDCLMNIPLLFWATEVTGERRYRDAAASHLLQTRRTIIRNDSTTYHTYYFDTDSGAPVRGDTNQGYSDDSCWARGQAWGIYGLALSYTYTRDASCIVDAKRLADYFLDHLPEDLVAYWDLVFIEGSEERDSSSAAIASCALLLLSSLLEQTDPDRERYRVMAYAMLASLAEHYTSKDNPASNGILLHGVYGKPNNAGIDECVVWGDYFYMEALSMVTGSGMCFW